LGEQKRIEAEKAKLAVLTTWVAQHETALEKEHECIAKMRASIGAEPDALWEDPTEDQPMGSDQADLARLEARELVLRRKRGGLDLTEEQRQAIDVEADVIAASAAQKRRKIEHDLQAASHTA
jgi:hypothetical protein